MTYKKKVVIGDATLYLGDCMEVMPTIGEVDAVVTDPPYGIGADNSMHKLSGKKPGKSLAHKGDYKKTDWDHQPCPKSMIDLMAGASKSQIIFGGNYFELPPTQCWLVWDKENGTNNFADCELAWTNLKKSVRIKRHMWNGMLRKGGEQRDGHPTQKPVDVMKWCITHLPKDTEIILDPFMGSGTTGVACLQMGRKFIGIELDEEYFDIACERIQREHDQLKMF